MYPADKVSHSKNLLGRRHVWEVGGRVEGWGEEGGERRGKSGGREGEGKEGDVTIYAT